MATSTAEQARLGALIEARQTAQAEAEARSAANSDRAAELAREATSLKDLIARMEGDVASARKAAEAAAAADERSARRPKPTPTASEQGRGRAVPRSGAPAARRGLRRHQRPAAAAGRRARSSRGSAQPDGFGGTEKGLSLATRPQAVVSAPADGWVAFSGPYRTYGQFLIINAGGGYYIVLAGMEQVNVAPGQFVLAGEPVGTMGDGSVKTAAAYRAWRGRARSLC